MYNREKSYGKISFTAFFDTITKRNLRMVQDERIESYRVV